MSGSARRPSGLLHQPRSEQYSPQEAVPPAGREGFHLAYPARVFRRVAGALLPLPMSSGQVFWTRRQAGCIGDRVFSSHAETYRCAISRSLMFAFCETFTSF